MILILQKLHAVTERVAACELGLQLMVAPCKVLGDSFAADKPSRLV